MRVEVRVLRVDDGRVHAEAVLPDRAVTFSVPCASAATPGQLRHALREAAAATAVASLLERQVDEHARDVTFAFDLPDPPDVQSVRLSRGRLTARTAPGGRVGVVLGGGRRLDCVANDRGDLDVFLGDGETSVEVIPLTSAGRRGQGRQVEATRGAVSDGRP